MGSAPNLHLHPLVVLHFLYRIVKLVRAIRKGWLKTKKERSKPQEPPVYLLWADDDAVADKAASGLTYIPAAKPKLPGHEESYNPPKEYLPTEVCRSMRQDCAGLRLFSSQLESAARLSVPSRPTVSRVMRQYSTRYL